MESQWAFQSPVLDPLNNRRSETDDQLDTHEGALESILLTQVGDLYPRHPKHFSEMMVVQGAGTPDADTISSAVLIPQDRWWNSHFANEVHKVNQGVKGKKDPSSSLKAVLCTRQVGSMQSKCNKNSSTDQGSRLMEVRA